MPMLADQSVFSIVTWSLILVVLIIAGWMTVWQVRRRLTKADETSGAGFTLSDLRQLHKSGQMSDEEFERAKARVVDAARRATEREATGKTADPGAIARAMAERAGYTSGKPASPPDATGRQPPAAGPNP